MSGKLLVIDHVAGQHSTMKQRLSGAFYDVSQADNLTDAHRCIDSEAPDMVLMDSRLSSEDALGFCRNLRSSPKTAHLPVVLLTSSDDRGFRIQALRAGADDVLVRPVNNAILLPRLRSLMRRNEFSDNSLIPKDTVQALGLADARTDFQARASVLITTQDSATAQMWQHLLQQTAPYDFATQILDDALKGVSEAPVPDVFVIMPDAANPDVSLRLIAEIRARSATRHSAVLVVLNQATRALHGDALDLGAQDVMNDGFDSEEMALRISKLVQQKRLSEKLRDNVKHGLRAAVTDPLTGLFNRRYAMTHLAQLAEQAAVKDRKYALLIADLDRFKTINDTFGHNTGDEVLIATAQRLRNTLRPIDLLARIGGEEFLIALPNVTKGEAEQMAEQLCQVMRQSPIEVSNLELQVQVTMSLGVALGGNHNLDRSINALLSRADGALYQAKSDGRDRVCLA